METRIFVKMMGVDEDGNTGPIGPDNKRLENFYRENGVSILKPDVSFNKAQGNMPGGIHSLREPYFCEVTGEVLYKKTMLEAVTEWATHWAKGRPFFIGTVHDIPPQRAFRDAFTYDDSGKTPRVGVDMAIAKEMHKERLAAPLRKKLAVVNDPLKANDKKAQAEAQKIIEAFNGLDLSKIKTLEELEKVTLDV